MNEQLIVQVSTNYGLNPALIRAQVLVESGGDEFAIRYEHDFFARYIKNNPTAKAYQYGPFAACSVGLLQVMVEVAYELGFDGRPEQLFDAKVGLEYGCKKMIQLLAETKGDYNYALHAYNAGLGTPYDTVYVSKVMKNVI
jgi:soluble lytic murein transglycosylase-like protein